MNLNKMFCLLLYSDCVIHFISLTKTDAPFRNIVKTQEQPQRARGVQT